MDFTTIKGSLAGNIRYKYGKRDGFPSRFTATTVNASGNRMKARVRCPAQTDNGATCPPWEVTKTINLPAWIDESADRVAVRAAIYRAIERMGIGSFDTIITFTDD